MKIQKTLSNVSPFAGISFVDQSFNKCGLSQLIDNELGQRVKTFGYSYSEIIRNLTNVFLSGGSCAEDIHTHLGKYLKSIPGNNVPSADTVLRGIKELATPNTTYTSKQNKDYEFNINKDLNSLNIKSLLLTNQLQKGISYDFGWKHLPCSFMNENTAFLIITAMIKNFYNYVVGLVSKVFGDIKPTTRLKRFIFRFISVAGKWIFTARQWVLKLYTGKPYERLSV